MTDTAIRPADAAERKGDAEITGVSDDIHYRSRPGTVLQPAQQWRDIATRYANHAALYRANLVLIAVIIWLT